MLKGKIGKMSAIRCDTAVKCRAIQLFSTLLRPGTGALRGGNTPLKGLSVLAGVHGQTALPFGGGVPRADGDIFGIIRLATADTHQNRAYGEQQK